MDSTQLEAIVCAILTTSVMQTKQPNTLTPPVADVVTTYQQILTAMRERGGPLKA